MTNSAVWDWRMYSRTPVTVSRTELAAIERFVARVCERAEANMLKTGKLEGAHYAAMTTVLEELQAKLEPEALV